MQRFIFSRILGSRHPLQSCLFSTKKTTIPGQFELPEAKKAELEVIKHQIYTLAQQSEPRRNKFEIESLIERLYKEFPPCLHVFNIVLKSRILINDTNGIRNVVESFAKHDLKPNNITYNLLISYYRNIGRLNDALLLLEKMKQSGVRPDVSAYTTIIAGFAKSKNLEMAERLFQEMHKEAVDEPDLFAFNTMAIAYMNADKFDEAFNIIKEMESKGVIPNLVSYKILISLYLCNKKPIDALKVYKTKVLSDKWAKPPDHCEILTKFLKTGHWNQSMEIFWSCQKKYGPSNRQIAEVLISYLSQNGQDQLIETIYEEALHNEELLVNVGELLTKFYLGNEERSRELKKRIELLDK